MIHVASTILCNHKKKPLHIPDSSQKKHYKFTNFKKFFSFLAALFYNEHKF